MVSITVAIVRMKEEEKVKNSYSNDVIMQVPSWITILIIIIIIMMMMIIIIINWTLLDTLKSYNLKDKNKTISNIYNFKLYIRNRYSFKIFPRFWLAKTTRKIHHNQLLFSKFLKILRHIESMTSKVQPAAGYWTVDRENLGTRLCYIWCAEKQRAKWRNSFKNEEIFWMNNRTILEFRFRRI